MFSLSGQLVESKISNERVESYLDVHQTHMRDLLTAMFEDINEMNRSNVFALHIDSESTGRPCDAAV